MISKKNHRTAANNGWHDLLSFLDLGVPCSAAASGNPGSDSAMKHGYQTQEESGGGLALGFGAWGDPDAGRRKGRCPQTYCLPTTSRPGVPPETQCPASRDGPGDLCAHDSSFCRL